MSHLSADDPEIARALWSVVGSGSSIANKVLAYVAPDDPIHLLLPEEAARETQVLRWMLRVMDALKAVAAMGFSPTVTGWATLRLEDPLLPDNSGSWRLEVSGDAGVLVRTEATDSALRLGLTASLPCMPGHHFTCCVRQGWRHVANRPRTSCSTRRSPAARHTCLSTSDP